MCAMCFKILAVNPQKKVFFVDLQQSFFSTFSEFLNTLDTNVHSKRSVRVGSGSVVSSMIG